MGYREEREGRKNQIPEFQLSLIYFELGERTVATDFSLEEKKKDQNTDWLDLLTPHLSLYFNHTTTLQLIYMIQFLS